MNYRYNNVIKKISVGGIVALLCTCFLLLFSCDDFSLYSQLDGEEGLRILAEGGIVTDALTITPEDVVIPVDTSYIFSAAGGSQPYTFSLVSGEGSIDLDTGTYSAPSDPGEAVVAVTDNEGSIREASITIISVGDFTISPTSITLYTFSTTMFSAVGGVPPYIFSLVSGSGMIDGQSGIYIAPSSPGTDVVRVTDSLGNSSDATINILTPFSLTPTELTITVTSSYTFTAAGGMPPYAFAMVSGLGSIDPGTGEFNSLGVDTSVISASDSIGNYQTAEITIIPPGPLLISPTSITLNVNDTTTFTATGGTPNYDFTIQSGNGSIGLSTGLYTAPPAPGTDIVKVTDSVGGSSTAVVSIVSAGPLAIIPAAVVVEQNEMYNFSADGGSPPYIFSVEAGSGTINPSSGWYSAPGPLGSETVRVTDSLSNWEEASVSVAPAAPTNLVADGTVPGPQDLELTWTDNATGEDGFIIERKDGSGGVFIQIMTVGPNTTNWTDTLLTPNMVYGYRVKANFGGIESGYSNESYDISNS